MSNLKLLCQKKITECIRAVGSGEKHLVIQTTLMRPLDRMCGAGFLKSCGISKIYKLEDYCATVDFVEENLHVSIVLVDYFGVLLIQSNFSER